MSIVENGIDNYALNNAQQAQREAGSSVINPPKHHNDIHLVSIFVCGSGFIELMDNHLYLT